MTTHRTRGFAAAVILALLTGAPTRCIAQARELDLEKILNPMPEYDPFETPAAAPQFFPDAVDKRARELLIDTLTNRNQALQDHLEFLKKEDARLQKEQRTGTGLTERAQDIVNNTIQDREKNLAAYRQALRDASTPERKKYLEAVINRDDHFQSEQLMRQSSTNFWGGLVNRMLGSIDLVGVASGNYIGAAAETAISQLYALMDRDMPIEERRALARDFDHLKRYPDDPKNAQVRKQIESLDKKKRDVLVAKQLAKAKEALNKGDDDRALFHAQVAVFFDPRSRDAEKLRQQTAKTLDQRQEARRQSLKARAEENLTPQQQADTRKLLEALSLRDANLIQRVAIDTEKKYPGKPLADAARDAEAVALEMKGWHEAARKAVEQNARKATAPVTKERAEALLQSPGYNLLSRFADARTERQLESAKYVLLGDDFLRKNVLFAAGAMAAAGPGGIATLGMTNALIWSRNLFQVMTNNPISAQPVIDAGVAYVRSHPKSENASDVYRVLADAYEERGMVERALIYHELAGSPKDKIAALNEQAARALLHAASKSASRSSQENYLKAVIDYHPNSSAAAEATKKLAALVKDENQGMRMSKQFLLEHREIWGPRGLALKATLFDGDPRNMEIADRGAVLLNDNELLVFYQTPWGVRSQSHRLAKATAERFFIALREKNQQVAAADANQRAKDSVGGIRNVPTTILRGEREQRGSGSEDREDTTFTLIREAGGTSYRRVLDAQLITENERNPGSQYQLPPIQGSISASRFSMTGGLPAGFGGSQLAVGTDRGSAYGGVQIPIPLLQGFVPVDFMVQGRPGGVAVIPHIRTGVDKGSDPELYR
ncbi:MAG TPA: hypothetical protein VFK65_26205 [Candidatus Binatia bacterium]|nr:hypothetical protein [Candidatus Binatia bacterium]